MSQASITAATAKKLVGQILDGENPIVDIAHQSSIKAELYFRAKLIRSRNSRLVLRKSITLHYRVQTPSSGLPLDVVWVAGDEAPRIAADMMLNEVNTKPLR